MEKGKLGSEMIEQIEVSKIDQLNISLPPENLKSGAEVEGEVDGKVTSLSDVACYVPS